MNWHWHYIAYTNKRIMKDTTKFLSVQPTQQFFLYCCVSIILSKPSKFLQNFQNYYETVKYMAFSQKSSWLVRTLHLSEVWTCWLCWILVPVCRGGLDIKPKVYLNFTQPWGTKKSDKPVQNDKFIYACMVKNTLQECLYRWILIRCDTSFIHSVHWLCPCTLSFIQCFSNHFPSERKVACHVCTFEHAATRQLQYSVQHIQQSGGLQ